MAQYETETQTKTERNRAKMINLAFWIRKAQRLNDDEIQKLNTTADAKCEYVN